MYGVKKQTHQETDETLEEYCCTELHRTARFRWLCLLRDNKALVVDEGSIVWHLCLARQHTCFWRYNTILEYDCTVRAESRSNQVLHYSKLTIQYSECVAPAPLESCRTPTDPDWAHAPAKTSTRYGPCSSAPAWHCSPPLYHERF